MEHHGKLGVVGLHAAHNIEFLAQLLFHLIVTLGVLLAYVLLFTLEFDDPFFSRHWVVVERIVKAESYFANQRSGLPNLAFFLRLRLNNFLAHRVVKHRTELVTVGAELLLDLIALQLDVAEVLLKVLFVLVYY